jgi:haloacetate dehalogenase
MAGFDERHFKAETVTIDAAEGIHIFVRSGGRADGPPLLLLHGFPQTSAIWHRVARLLAPHFFLVMPDVRGYGASSKPASDGQQHQPYSKRAMAADMVTLMRAHFRTDRFGLVGHDRGGRVAHRLAVDHPDAVDKLAVLDIAPTLDMYARTDMAFARAYYHWFHLIQPEPLPERMILGSDGGRFYLHWKLGGWGSAGLGHIEPEALAEYERSFCTPEAVHAACEDYRASAGIDLEHDRASRAAGERIACDTLVLWGERGVVHRMFEPLALWQAQCAGKVSGHTLPCGHYLPEEQPEATAKALLGFFGG